MARAATIHHHTHVHIYASDSESEKKTKPKAAPVKKYQPAMDYNAGIDMFTPSASPEHGKRLADSIAALFGEGKTKK